MCDGFTASAILINYLNKAKPYFDHDNWPEFKYLFHPAKIHGLDDTDIMKQLRDIVKPALLIIPDASGTNMQYAALNDLGIEILVLDHHHVTELGGLKTIVVNNQQSPNYLNKGLTGAGVVWQFTRILDEKLGIQFADDSLDLVAVGLAADVADLRDKETRFLIKEGLKQARLTCPLIQQCLFANDYKIQGSLNPIKVTFQISPLFNAVCRIGSLEEKELLFQSLLDDANSKLVPSGNRNKKGEMVPLVVEAYRVITNARSRQNRRQDKLMELIDNVIQSEELSEDKVLLIAIDKGDFEEEHRNLAGLVCNKLQSYYQRPIIILFENDNGTYTGSVRAPSDVEAFSDFRQQCEDSGLTIYNSGHPAAFGLGIESKYINSFVQYFNDRYSNIDVAPTYYCDFIADANDPEIGFAIEEISNYSNDWGTGLPEPLICLGYIPRTHHSSYIRRTGVIRYSSPLGCISEWCTNGPTPFSHFIMHMLLLAGTFSVPCHSHHGNFLARCYLLPLS